MLGPIATLLVAGPLFWVVSWAWGWYRNYVIAKRTGLPVLMCPFSIDKVSCLFFSLFFTHLGYCYLIYNPAWQ